MSVARCRQTVLAGGILAMLVKVYTAARTGGVDDVFLFGRFADAVHRYGPVMVYGKPVPGVTLPYNHPPLTGLMLVAFYYLQHHLGVSFAFMIRMPSTFADLVTTLLVFELVRSRRPLRDAVVAAIAVSASPILFIISGYHGNTDPVFVMFSILSLYLLTVRQFPVLTAVLAGASFACSLSVKIVPIVALPVLLLIAARTGTRRLLAYLASSGLVMAVLWLPVVVRNWGPFKTNVLEYHGISQRQWGIIQLGRTIGAPHGLLIFLQEPGRFLILLISALVPLVLAWRRPEKSIPAVGLTLMIFLLLSPATATQYLSWAAAPALLAELWSALAYNLVGGVFLLRVYDSWNRAHPWHWRRTIAWAHIWSHSQVIQAGVAWGVLFVAVIVSLLPRRNSSVARRQAVQEAVIAVDEMNVVLRVPDPVGVGTQSAWSE